MKPPENQNPRKREKPWWHVSHETMNTWEPTGEGTRVGSLLPVRVMGKGVKMGEGVIVVG